MGVRIERRSTRTANEATARQIALAAEHEIERKTVEERQAQALGTRSNRPITFGAAVNELTAAKTCPRIKPRLYDRLKDVELSKIDSILLNRVANELHPGSVAATRNRHVFTPIITVYRAMANAGYVSQREFHRPRRERGTAEQKQPRAGSTALAMEDAAAFIAAMNPHAAQAHTVLLFTGMRPIELVYLRPKDVDLVKNMIYIASSKTGDPRWVPIHTFIKPLLKAWAEISAKVENTRLLMDHTGANYCIPDADDPNDDREGGWFKTAVRTARKRTGISNASTYSLRHTFSTEIWRTSDRDEYLTNKLMGHSPTNINEKHYVHHVEARMKAVIEALPVPELLRRQAWASDPYHPWRKGNRYLLTNRYKTRQE